MRTRSVKLDYVVDLEIDETETTTERILSELDTTITVANFQNDVAEVIDYELVNWEIIE